MSETERSETGALVAGRYRLGDAIGHGGMATVFRARDEKLERLVAVKVFTPGEPDSDDTARRLREMRLLAAANHPHLVTLFDAELPTAELPRPGFLVMELVEGESLRRRLDRRGADAELARQVVIELSGALAYLHEQGIVHRDLKPENILIDSATGATKLVDFGIAQFVGAERITTDGMVFGTAAYLSPEQVRGGPVPPAADVYALGLVVLECLTGKRVFPGPAVEAAIARMTSDPPIPSGLPEGWGALLSAMTAREPERRPDAGTIAAAAWPLGVPTLPSAEGDTVAMTAPPLSDVYEAGSRPGATAGAEAGTTGPTMRYAVAAEASVPASGAAPRGSNGAPPARVGASPRSAPRRRWVILFGAVAAAVLGGAVLAFALDVGQHHADAGPTTPTTPAPTVTVTGVAPQHAATPAVRQAVTPAAHPAATPASPSAHTAPTPLPGSGSGVGVTGAPGLVAPSPVAPSPGAPAPVAPGAGAPSPGIGVRTVTNDDTVPTGAAAEPAGNQ